MIAHPKIDPVTGELISTGYSAFMPYLVYHQVDKQGVLVRSEVIDIKGPTQIHDMAITANYAIFFDLPVVLDPNLHGGPQLPYRWDPGYGARVGIMHRSGDNADVRWFEAEPCYVYHSLNAYEDGDHCRRRGGPISGSVQSRSPRRRPAIRTGSLPRWISGGSIW